jgi:hypothetical protein
MKAGFLCSEAKANAGIGPAGTNSFRNASVVRGQAPRWSAIAQKLVEALARPRAGLATDPAHVRSHGFVNRAEHAPCAVNHPFLPPCRAEKNITTPQRFADGRRMTSFAIIATRARQMNPRRVDQLTVKQLQGRAARSRQCDDTDPRQAREGVGKEADRGVATGDDERLARVRPAQIRPDEIRTPHNPIMGHSS